VSQPVRTLVHIPKVINFWTTLQAAGSSPAWRMTWPACARRRDRGPARRRRAAQQRLQRRRGRAVRAAAPLGHAQRARRARAARRAAGAGGAAVGRRGGGARRDPGRAKRARARALRGPPHGSVTGRAPRACQQPSGMHSGLGPTAAIRRRWRGAESSWWHGSDNWLPCWRVKLDGRPCLLVRDMSAGAACNPCASLLCGAQLPSGVTALRAMLKGGQALLYQNSVKLCCTLCMCGVCLVQGAGLRAVVPFVQTHICACCAACLSLCLLIVFWSPAKHAAGLEHMPWCCVALYITSLLQLELSHPHLASWLCQRSLIAGACRSGRLLYSAHVLCPRSSLYSARDAPGCSRCTTHATPGRKNAGGRGRQRSGWEFMGAMFWQACGRR